MPFTFSHPAIVLPLAWLPRHWFSLTGLVIGSLTPDFEYFLRMRIQSDYSHTLGGLFWFDLPMGLILAFTFHNVVRNSLFQNLPVGLRSRFQRFRHFDWNAYFKKNWPVVLISILLGAASHLFWDSFTHEHGYFVERIPALTNAVGIMGYEIPMLKILQHASTVIGAVVIAAVIYLMPKDKTKVGTVNKKFWLLFMLLTVVIVALRLFSGLDYHLFGHVVVTVISASLISLVLSSVLVGKFNGID